MIENKKSGRPPHPEGGLRNIEVQWQYTTFQLVLQEKNHGENNGQ